MHRYRLAIATLEARNADVGNENVRLLYGARTTINDKCCEILHIGRERERRAVLILKLHVYKKVSVVLCSIGILPVVAVLHNDACRGKIGVQEFALKEVGTWRRSQKASS